VKRTPHTKRRPRGLDGIGDGPDSGNHTSTNSVERRELPSTPHSRDR